jgi:hypothetical protein
MITDKCISVTDLRMHTKKYIDDLKKGEKIIFINNKPKAVLIDIQIYEHMLENPVLTKVPEKEVTAQLKKDLAKARKIPKNQLVNL